MTAGPMPCMTCGRSVWYGEGQMWSRYYGTWRRHSCRLGLALRRWYAEQPRVDPNARKRRWRLRQRVAA